MNGREMSLARRISRAAAVVLLLSIPGCQRAQEDRALTVVSFGGAYQSAQSKAYMQPYGAENGLQVVESDYNGDYGILQQRATAPTGAWDVVSVESAPTERASKEGLLLKLPDSIFTGLRLTPGARRPYAAGHLVFSTVLAYNREAWPTTTPPPSTWADFWDTKKYPGKRGLRNNPRGTLEIALLASGVDPSSLYPLDLDRAFAALDSLRPHILFWTSGAQPVQLLANREVVMSSAYNGRIWDAREKQGLPLAWSWNQGLMETEYWVVPKNAPHPEEAVRFIAFALREAQQATFSNEIAYGPTNLGALPHISTEITQAVPNSPEALPKQIPVDPDWWAANEAAVNARWERWQNRR